MKHYLLAVVMSVLLAEWLEFWYRFGATWDPQAFVGATAPYTIMMLVFHAILTRAPRLPRTVWLALGCLPGMALEWFAIGNSPWGNPDAWQLGMVLFHGAYPLWGRIFDPAWFGPRQRRAGLWLLAGSTVFFSPGFLITHEGWRYAFFVLLPIGFYAALWAVVVFNRPRDG